MKTTTLAGHELRLHEQRWKCVAAVLPGVILTALHGTMLDLPRADIIDALDSDRYRIYWILGSYLWGAATGMAMTGFWSGRLGLRGCYFSSLLLFVVASGSCGLVSDELHMVPLRLLAGYGTGLAISSAMVLIWKVFPEDKELAMAIYGIGLYLAAILGSSLGGFLVHAFSWRSVFLVNFPIGFIILVFGVYIHPTVATLQQESKPFDLVGFLLFAGWVLTMIVVLVMGQYWGWFCSPFFVPWFLALVVAFSGFVIWGVFARDPLINLRPLAVRNFGLGLCIKGVFAIDLYLLLGFISSYMINLRGYQWWQGALVFLPGFCSMLGTMLIGARWGRDHNRKARMFLGMAGMTVMTWYIAAHVDLYWSKVPLSIALTLWAACAGFVIGPAMLTIFHGFSSSRLGYAAGVYNIIRTLPAFCVGALLVILLTRQSDFQFDRLRLDITHNRPLVTETYKRIEHHFAERGSGRALQKKQAQALMTKWVHANARVFAFRTGLKYLALVTALGPLLILFLHPPPTIVSAQREKKWSKDQSTSDKKYQPLVPLRDKAANVVITTYEV